MLKYTGVINSIRRDPEMVFRAVRSFLTQKIAPTEVILVDQNPKAMPIPPDIQKHPHFRRIHHQVPSVSLARNFVGPQLKTEWVIFCDDDGYLDENYTAHLQTLIFEDPRLELVCGPYVNIEDGKYYSQRHQIEAPMRSLWGAKLLLGSNIVIRSKLFQKIGGYDTRFGPGAFFPSSEEADLCWKVIEQNVPMKYSKNLIVRHPAPHHSHWPTAAKKAFLYGQGKGALSAKWVFEKNSRLGYWEVVEMNLVPLAKIILALPTLKWSQIPIQFSVLAGRWLGLWKFLSCEKIKFQVERAREKIFSCSVETK